MVLVCRVFRASRMSYFEQHTLSGVFNATVAVRNRFYFTLSYKSYKTLLSAQSTSKSNRCGRYAAKEKGFAPATCIC